jgi:hypothetical protein
MAEGLLVAIKILTMIGFWGHKEWLTEINYPSCMKTLLKLIGYGIEKAYELRSSPDH